MTELPNRMRRNYLAQLATVPAAGAVVSGFLAIAVGADPALPASRPVFLAAAVVLLATAMTYVVQALRRSPERIELGDDAILARFRSDGESRWDFDLPFEDVDLVEQRRPYGNPFRGYPIRAVVVGRPKTPARAKPPKRDPTETRPRVVPLTDGNLAAFLVAWGRWASRNPSPSTRVTFVPASLRDTASLSVLDGGVRSGPA